MRRSWYVVNVNGQRVTVSYHAQAEEEILHPSAPEVATLPSSGTPSDSPEKKKKGPQAPNPLSAKKKKPKNEASERDHTSEKRKRAEDDGVEAQPSQRPKRKRRRKAADHSEDGQAEKAT